MNIELQVTGSALRAVAEEMGAALVRAAFSANIKERRDCSAALFDAISSGVPLNGLRYGSGFTAWCTRPSPPIGYFQV